MKVKSNVSKGAVGHKIDNEHHDEAYVMDNSGTSAINLDDEYANTHNRKDFVLGNNFKGSQLRKI